MLEICSSYCLILSLTGWVFLLGLGVTISVDYPYNRLENSGKAGVACYVASAIYAIFPIFWFYRRFKRARNKIFQGYQEIPSEPQEIQLHEIRRSEQED